MLKQQAQLFTRIAISIDAICIGASFFIAYNLVQRIGGRLTDFHDYLWVLMFIIPIWLFLGTYFGLYASMRTKPIGHITANILKVHVIGGVLTTSYIFLIDPHGFSRLLLATFILISLLLTVATKGSIKLLLGYFRKKGYNIRHILLVGSGEKANHFLELVRRHATWGIVIADIINFNDDATDDALSKRHELGSVENLADICRSQLIDEVVFCLSRENLTALDNYLELLQQMGITVRMVIDFFDIPPSNMELSMFHDELPILTFYGHYFDASQLLLKRCMDIAGAIVGLVFTAFIFPALAIAIRLESPGPIFFDQLRVGENGRTFRCWKFRSMYVDAEERKKDLMVHNEMWGAMFKMKHDPRVTKVGRFIRKTSIDEFPQFWNVLKADMSLVGTRPPTPEEVANYENWHRKRICMKPGITGLWQVSGRNQIHNFDEVARLDIRYIEQWSLWLDIKLLFKTIWVVITGRGAQ